jgi:hypothetical protein
MNHGSTANQDVAFRIEWLRWTIEAAAHGHIPLPPVPAPCCPHEGTLPTFAHHARMHEAGCVSSYVRRYQLCAFVTSRTDRSMRAAVARLSGRDHELDAADELRAMNITLTALTDSRAMGWSHGDQRGACRRVRVHG